MDSSLTILFRLVYAPEFYQEGDGNIPDQLLTEAIQHAPKTGLFMEFGVASGRSIRHIRHCMNQRGINELLFGFDSFRGLPEDWVDSKGEISHPKGDFACDVPDSVQDVIFIEGLFQDTLTSFLMDYREPAAFVHVDCDLYSSAFFVLDQLYRANRIVPGTVIQFDEMIGEQRYVEHECKAFCEFAKISGMEYDVLGKSRIAVAVKFK